MKLITLLKLALLIFVLLFQIDIISGNPIDKDTIYIILVTYVSLRLSEDILKSKNNNKNEE